MDLETNLTQQKTWKQGQNERTEAILELQSKWKGEIEKRNGEVYIESVIRVLREFLDLSDEEKIRVMNLEKFREAYDYFRFTFHSNFQQKIFFDKVYDGMFDAKKRVLDKYKN